VENLWAEIADDVKEEALTGKTLTNTVTPNRINLVTSQKAKSLLKYISEFKSGRGEWRAPATELILLEDDFDVVDAALVSLTLLMGSCVHAQSSLGMVCLSQSG
jgi:hypothetical protein